MHPTPIPGTRVIPSGPHLCTCTHRHDSPFPLRPVLQSPRNQKIDLLIQSEQVYGYNGGFYLARARASTRVGVRSWMDDLVRTLETNPSPI